MKRNILVALILIVLLLAWASTPFWVPATASLLSKPEAAPGGVPPSSAKEAGTNAGVRDLAPAGQFGEMFGSINALFSGLALIGVAYGLYLQLEHKRRDKQPEVFARLATNSTEQHPVLAPMDTTPAGEVHLTLAVPVFIDTGTSTAAFNVAIIVRYSSLGSQTLKLPVPVLSRSETEAPSMFNLVIKAAELAKLMNGWRAGAEQERSLGELEVKIEFENQQQAKWEITAKYGLAVRSDADEGALQVWINNATARPASPLSIQLESSAISWTPRAL